MTSRAVVDDVVARLTRLLGRDPADDRGVLHSAYVASTDAGLRVLCIGPHTPPCADDTFLLHAARARASAIVTTGRILRDEPQLHYDLGVAAGLHDALLAYREHRVGRADPPTVVVLSRGGVPLAHPALRGYARARIVLTGEPDAAFDAAASAASVPIDRLPGADLVAVLGWLRAGGHDTVLVEAGVATTGPVYARGEGFDELVLTTLERGGVDPRAVGAPFPGVDALVAWYGPPRHQATLDESGRRFVVRRFRRPAPASVAAPSAG